MVHFSSTSSQVWSHKANWRISTFQRKFLSPFKLVPEISQKPFKFCPEKAISAFPTDCQNEPCKGGDFNESCQSGWDFSLITFVVKLVAINT